MCVNNFARRNLFRSNLPHNFSDAKVNGIHLSQARISAAPPPLKHPRAPQQKRLTVLHVPHRILYSKKEALHSCRSRRQHQSSTCALFFVSFFPYSLACFSFAPYFYLRAQLKKLPIPPQPRHRRSPSYPTIPPSPCASIPSASLISTNSAPPMPRNFLSKLCRPTQ